MWRYLPHQTMLPLNKHRVGILVRGFSSPWARGGIQGTGENPGLNMTGWVRGLIWGFGF